MKGMFRNLTIALVTVAVVATVAFAGALVHRDNMDVFGDWRFFNGVDLSLSKGELKVPVPYAIPLGAFSTNGTPIAADGTTAPGIALHDSVPAIVWATTEVTPIEATFRLPAGMEGDNLRFKVLVSTSDATTPNEVDWSLYINKDGVAFGSELAQTAVACTDISTTLAQEYTLTPNSTAAAALVSGAWVTLKLWNTSTGGGNLELKGVDYYFDN